MRLLLGFFLIVSHVWAAPKIVVSIPPVHSIVSNLTQGVTEPALLLKNNQSAHQFHLKPVQLSLMENADLLVIIHPEFEAGLAKVFGQQPKSKRITVASDSQKSQHLWLDISSIKAFAKKLAHRLIDLDAQHRDRYLANLTQLDQRLTQLEADMAQQLHSVNRKPLATYSNALNSLVKTQQLNQITSVVKQHEQRYSIKRILQAKQAIRQHQVGCLIATTEVTPKQLQLLSDGATVNTVRINILGSDLTPGRQLYFQLMQSIAQEVYQCLR